MSTDYPFIYSQHDSPSRITDVDALRSKDRGDGQVNVRPEPRRSSASAPSSLGRSKNPSQVPISASPVVSALDKFNKNIANCDAMERFQMEPNRCLGNRTTDGLKCRTPMKPQNKEVIVQLLTELAAISIEGSTPECVIDKLRKLIELTICRHQCKKLQGEVDRLVLPDPPKDSTCQPAGPIIEETIKDKIEEVPSSPVTLSTTDFTPWWDKASKSALQYLADYLPYQRSKLVVSTWVETQANTPLTKRELDTGSLYVYWNQANFGVYKIGYSTVDVTQRLRKWETQCKHTAQRLYWSRIKVPNVRRLERLVHAELKDYRVKEECCHGCKRGHNEWFIVDFNLIQKSIAFWTGWIRKGQ